VTQYILIWLATQRRYPQISKFLFYPEDAIYLCAVKEQCSSIADQKAQTFYPITLLTFYPITHLT
jgi:hypothetical protein